MNVQIFDLKRWPGLRHLRTIQGIQNFFQWQARSCDPGFIFCKCSAADEWRKLDLVKGSVRSGENSREERLRELKVFQMELLEKLAPNGMTAKREWELYDDVRPHGLDTPIEFNGISISSLDLPAPLPVSPRLKKRRQKSSTENHALISRAACVVNRPGGKGEESRE